MKVYDDQRRDGDGLFADQVASLSTARKLVFEEQRRGAAAVFIDQVHDSLGPQLLSGAGARQQNSSGQGQAQLVILLEGSGSAQANSSGRGLVYAPALLAGNGSSQSNTSGHGRIYTPPRLRGEGSSQANTSGVGMVATPLVSTGSTLHQRLLGHVHSAVFDKAPHDQLLFRLRHPRGASWLIADGVMKARYAQETFSFDLKSLTVQQLAVALGDRGFDVSDLAVDSARASALVLVEGHGDQGTSNGDRITGYTSLLWVVLGGYTNIVRDAGEQIVQALRQMVITHAEGEWLDLWGKLYNLARGKGEADASFALRIPREAFRLRESPIAIEDAVKDATGKTIRIEEPWQRVFRLDTSQLSGGDGFQDGRRIGSFLIQPTSMRPLDWSDVLPVIERNRAAGIKVLPPFARNGAVIDAGLDAFVHSSRSSTHYRLDRYEDRTFLDYSAIEDVAILNHPILRQQERLHRSTSTSVGWMDTSWPNEVWTDSPYHVFTYNYRSYRLYSSAISYEDQYWQDELWQDIAWVDFDIRVYGGHSRSPS